MLKKLTLAATISFLLAGNAFAEGFTLSADGFTNNADGTVTDTKTGLIWQACAVGQTFNTSTGSCDGNEKAYTYADTMKLTSNFGGQSDWRVPTISELNSIVDLRKVNPSINKSLFPNPPAVWFWSASVDAYYPSFAWIVNFNYGYGDSNYKGGNYAVRLVRGGQSFYFDTLKLVDFTDNKDGTVTSTKTGLTWQRCAVGQTWSDGYCDGTAATYTQADAAKLTSNVGGQSDWHLPSLRELQTIVDYSQFNPSTNLIIFPDAPSNTFWTTTTKAEVTDNFWMVAFDYGASSYNTKTATYSARLVRGTLSTSGAATTTPVVAGGVDLVPTITGTPNPATVNGNITFTATLTNKGSGTATDAKMSFGLPKNTVSLVTKPDECNFNGLSVVCAVGNVVPNGSITKSVTVKMTKAGGLSFGVTAWSAEKDLNMKDNIARATVAIRK
ncbi:MAG: DUF1566 domain-containing protein [Methylococcaceae bacterium]